jgi:hypothetical protein
MHMYECRLQVCKGVRERVERERLRRQPGCIHDYPAARTPAEHEGRRSCTTLINWLERCMIHTLINHNDWLISTNVQSAQVSFFNLKWNCNNQHTTKSTYHIHFSSCISSPFQQQKQYAVLTGKGFVPCHNFDLMTGRLQLQMKFSFSFIVIITAKGKAIPSALC